MVLILCDFLNKIAIAGLLSLLLSTEAFSPFYRRFFLWDLFVFRFYVFVLSVVKVSN